MIQDKSKENNRNEHMENKLVPPKEFNPRIANTNLKDERFFAFEAQKAHH